MQRLLGALCALALLLTGCGSDDTTTAGEPADTTQTSGGAQPLPGERVEIFPYEGAQLAVVGVAADDTLKVRSGPGVDFDVVFELEPLAMDVTATGHNRSVPDAGFWSEITARGERGWANTAYLLQPGRTTDVTAALFPTPADRPSAETMLELGRAVAELEASEEPPSDIVVVDGPSVGDLGEITVDVIGFGDDSQGGVRLKVFGEPDPGGESFTVRSVEATTLCTRDVTADGICV